MVAIDICGRPFLNFNVKFRDKHIGEMEALLIEDFFYGFASELKCSLHIDCLRGRSDHHRAESIFKAFGRALKEAVVVRRRGVIPSTKGVL